MSYPYYNNKPQYYDGSTNDTRVQVQTEQPNEIKRWNWCAHGWSFFAIFCCPCCIFSSMFAAGGLVCATGAYSDHKAGDYERSQYKKNCAIGWTIAAIIFGAGAAAAGGYFLYFYFQTLLGIFQNAAQG